MAKLVERFDASRIDPTQTGGSFPVGRHPVVITHDELKATKDNTSGYLELTLTIIDGPNKGQSGPYRLNLYNNSQQAKEIAQRKLSAICHAIGVFQVDDGIELHNKPFVVEAALQQGEEAKAKGYTEIVKVFDIHGNEPGKAPQQQAAQTTGGGQSLQPGWGATGQMVNTAPPAGQGWNQGGQQQPPQGGQGQGGWNQGQPGGQPQNTPPAGQGGGWQGNQPGQQAGNGGGSPAGGANVPWGQQRT